MRATVLGFTLPEAAFREVLASDPVMPTQTQRFAWGLVEALSANRASVDLISAVPVSNFPASKRLLIPHLVFEERGVAGILLPFVNALVFKHLTRFIACICFATKRIRQHRSEWLIVHGVHSPFLWYAVYARARTGARIAVVLTDPPGVVRRSDGRVARLLKRLDVRVTKGALGRFDAVIALSEPLGRDFAPGVPMLVMEGFVATPQTAGEHAQGRSGRPIIIYAGGLTQEYGVLSLAHAVYDSTLDVSLEFYGAGDAAEALVELAKRDSRIVSPVLVQPEELAQRYQRATALVQPRQPEQDFVRYSFPSKLIEYMATGVPVISTKLPSIPGDYDGHLIWAESADPVGLRRAIERCLTLSSAESEKLGREAAEFVRESRAPSSQGSRIVGFLETVGAASPGN